MSDDVLAALRNRFRERCAGDAEVLSAQLAGEADHAVLEPLIHRLAGAAGTFGYASLGEAAAVVDAGYAAGETPGRDELLAVLEELAALS